jgi:hypothetical protein
MNVQKSRVAIGALAVGWACFAAAVAIGLRNHEPPWNTSLAPLAVLSPFTVLLLFGNPSHQMAAQQRRARVVITVAAVVSIVCIGVIAYLLAG